MEEDSLKELLNISEEFDRIDNQKLIISSAIDEKIKEKNLSIRQLAKSIDGMGTAQISRLLRGENYTINTLLRVMDFLELEIVVRDREDA